MEQKRILIVEDDQSLQRELQTLMERNGYQGISLHNFTDPLEEMQSTQPDLILLDINLPGIDGQSLLREYRRHSQTPVIMVTSRNTEMDEMLCMSFGADDFIAKPYHPSILLLHIEAIFRRMGMAGEQLVYQDPLQGQLLLDLGRSIVEAQDQTVELSKNEMRILSYLLRNRGHIISRDELIRHLWDNEEFVDDNTLTVNINRVRKKLEDLKFADVIKTRRGQGYLIE